MQPLPLHKERQLVQFVDDILENEAETDRAAVNLLNQMSEHFVKEVILKSVELKNTRRSVSRNKSIRSEDVYTSFFDLPQYSFLHSVLGEKQNYLDLEILATSKKESLEKSSVTEIINPLLLEEAENENH